MNETLIPAFNTALAKVHRLRQHMSAELNMSLGIDAEVDEMSILFTDPQCMEDFVEYVGDNMQVEELPPVERTRVTRRDAPGQFDVAYRFLNFPQFEYRIECMHIFPELDNLGNEEEAFGEPSYPLHLPIAQLGVAHASWKCADIEQYNGHDATLVGQSIPREAEYENDYGRFTYWGKRIPYLKSRVNLRD